MNFRLFIKQYIKMFSQNLMLPIWYWICCFRPVLPGLVVFADAHHDSRPENMELLYQRLRQDSRIVIQELYMDYQKNSPVAVLKHMFSFMKLYAQAEIVIICDNFLPVASCKKRKHTKVIQLWHACGAFKKFGYDTADDIPKNYRGNVFKNINLVTVSAKACVRPFASAMRLSQDCVQPFGVSRTDVYFDKKWQEECQSKFYEKYPQAKGKKIVLWAPTFRGNPGTPELIKLDLERLQRYLGEKWMVLSRVHPHMHEQYKETDCSVMTEELFAVVDVLIADYSSLIFEYLLFDKPLVMYVPDLEEYQKSRGFYLNLAEIPGDQVSNEENLAAAIQQAEKGAHRKQREQFLENYMSACDGHATERIAEYILGVIK